MQIAVGKSLTSVFRYAGFSRAEILIPAKPVLLYYITDRRQFPGTDAEQQRHLLGMVRAAAQAGVDFIQLRERDLPIRQLEDLARQAVAIVRSAGSATRLLINSRLDVALASAADGVHLRADDIHPSDAR